MDAIEMGGRSQEEEDDEEERENESTWQEKEREDLSDSSFNKMNCKTRHFESASGEIVSMSLNDKVPALSNSLVQ